MITTVIAPDSSAAVAPAPAPPQPAPMPVLPSRPAMLRALLERDSAFEGLFFVGVKTTGIFCRPTCPAKKPRPENVEFFPTPSAALHAGFRPCLRCRPLDAGPRPPALVGRLRAAVERAPTGRLTDKELSALGIDPSTARRQFKHYHGMTFHAYHRARRLGLALREVRAGGRVTDAQLDHGFDSASGFREAFVKVFGQSPSGAKHRDCLLAQRIDTPLGAMLALANDDGLHLLEFVDRRALEREILQLRRHLRCAVVPGANRHLAAIRAQLGDYFAGRRLTFDVPLVLSGSDFQRRVWTLLRAIPPGATRSYSAMAAALRRPAARRAVGRANGSNRLCLVVPCHRVIRADGSLCGYGGGLWRKKWLLEHERKHLPESAKPAAR